uniref:BY PROTMAP: gi/472582238/gb/EMS19934.1/ HD domain containing protein [Rhodosporidium toruloides NP11] gi/647399659/emb/CDR44557.1/ RHTO0S09e06216g1_1 [Rhodosporidium toruloides] n=1 Tax=Rhodotorula toruloides TaxID=5286 RepID=A0A0K3CMN6_RHOTO
MTVARAVLDEPLLLTAAERLARAHHAQYDPSHDFYHVERVRRLALSIARSLPEPVDSLVVELAALFHDLLDAKYLPKDAPVPTAHEHLAGFWAENGAGLSEERRRLVERIIENVSHSKEVRRIKEGRQTEWHETCRELHCVQDADRLDAIGAIGALPSPPAPLFHKLTILDSPGIMRCSAYSALVSRPLYIPPSSSSASAEDPSTCALAHFDDKLLLLHERMRTEKGREMARRRTEVLRGFKEEVEREWREAVGEE